MLTGCKHDRDMTADELLALFKDAEAAHKARPHDPHAALLMAALAEALCDRIMDDLDDDAIILPADDTPLWIH